jgi:hypothetical protein
VGAKLGPLKTREVSVSHNFGDVPDDAFFHDFVGFLVDQGLTAGCGLGLFCPDQAVTRGQQAVFLKKLLEVGSLPQVVDATGRLVGRTISHDFSSAEVALEIEGRLFFVSANATGLGTTGSLIFTEPDCVGPPFLAVSGPDAARFPRRQQAFAILPPGKTLWVPDPSASPMGPINDQTASQRFGAGSCQNGGIFNFTLQPAIMLRDLSGLFQPPFDLL